MIKQPPQILKFFSSVLEVERDWNRKLKGIPGTHIVTEDILFIPPFQIKFNDRSEDLTDFTTIDLVNYETGVETDISTWIHAMGVFTYGDYQNFVVPRCPLAYLMDDGDYYLRIADGSLCEDSDMNEIWYSEVFKLCDLNRNLLRNFSVSGFNSDDANYLSTRDMWQVKICESAGDGGYFDQGNFYVTESEPLDFFNRGSLASLACGETEFLPLHFALVDVSGNVISNQIDGILGQIKGRFTPTKSGPARLRGWVEDGGITPVPGVDLGRSQWQNHLFYVNPQLYDGLITGVECNPEAENIGEHKVLRWGNTCNICDMIYEEVHGYIGAEFWTMAYENCLILDAVKDKEQNYGPSIVPQFEIEETVKQDDVFNNYQIVGVQKEWYALQLVTLEQLAKSIQRIRLHNLVELDIDGEAWTLAENRSELSSANDFNVLVKFIFREDTCPVDVCCFELCCPNLENIIDVLANTGALPACDVATQYDRYLVLDGGIYYIYECDGGNWNQLAENVDGNCLWDESIGASNDTPYMYWNEDRGNWYRFAYMTGATFNALTATVSLRNYSKPKLRCYIYVGVITAPAFRSEEFILTGEASETLTFDYTLGAATFHLVIYDVNGCDYGETHTVVATEE